jgi:hypothetical protein
MKLLTGSDTPADPSTKALERLRAAIMRGDPRADDLVKVEIVKVRSGTRIPLYLLLAEAFQWLDEIEAALESVAIAVVEAAALPADHPHRIAVLAVNADLTVWAGHSDAVQASTVYVEFARDIAQDMVLLTIAGALRAVALFHQVSCDEGRDKLLVALKNMCGDADPEEDTDPLVVILREGYKAMQDCCRFSVLPPPELGPLPMPGGMLNHEVDPEPTYPVPSALATRVRRHLPAHTCQFAALPDSAPQPKAASPAET